MKKNRSIPFHLNEELYVEPTARSSGFHSHLVGVKPNQLLILDYPFWESTAYEIVRSDVLWVRCFRHTVYRFRSVVLGVTKDPVPLLFLEYPQNIEEMEVRGSQRKKIFIRGRFLDLRDRTGRRSWEGYILDISDTGCLMWGDFVHLVDQDILLSFQVPWTGEKIQAKARVVRCEVTEKGIRSGLKFMDLTPETHRRLQKFIGSLKEDEISRMVSIESGKST
jgi:c-di-GMP-binding flagellar brake protein YcgR